eukprot:scaffold248651_cov45-Attheya_sp.AAC.4
MFSRDQLNQLSFGQDGIFHIETTEFNLTGLCAVEKMGCHLIQCINGPIIERTVVFEFQCTE